MWRQAGAAWAAFSIMASDAHAQETGAEPSSRGRTLETVRVTAQRLQGYETHSADAGKAPLDIMTTPQLIVVVPERFIQEFQPSFLDEALRTVSGVNQDNTFGNTTDGFTLRGFFADKIFRNGVRSINGRSLTPSTEHIEVLKGPASLLYGSIEPGGLVNVATKRPTFDDTPLEVAYQLSDRGGNRFDFDASGPLGQLGGLDVAYRLIGQRDTSDYWRNFGELDNTFVAPTLAIRGERLRAAFAYEYSDRDDPFDRGTVVVDDRIADIPQTRRLGEAFERLTERTNLFEVDVEYGFSDTTLLRLRGTYQDSESSDLQARPRRVAVDSAGNPVLVRRVDGTFGRYIDTTYLSASLLHQLDTGPISHTLLVGVDSERGTNGRDGFVQGPDEPVNRALQIYAPVYGTLDPALAPSIPSGPFEGRASTTGVYLQDTASIGEQWHVVLGGRYEEYESLSRTATIAVPTDDSSGDTILPRAGIVYQPRPYLSLYASYAESFQPNIFSPTLFAPGSPTSFDPQEGVSYEAGAKLEVRGVRLSAALFSIEKRNVLFVENQVPRLIDTAESEGFELDVGGNLGPATSVLASYAYVDSDGGNGFPLANVPRHTIGSTLTHRWQEGWLRGASFGVSGQYVGARDGGTNPTASPGGPEHFTLPSYAVFDVFAAYEWQTSLAPVHLQLNVRNAADEVYFASSGGSLRINPGQVRTVLGSIRLRF